MGNGMVSDLAGNLDASGVLAGQYDRKIGRNRLLTIPAGWVACLGESKSVFVMPDPHERSLNIMPSSCLESEMGRIRSNARNDKETLNALRVIATMCEQVVMDGQHRIRISDRLLEFAGIADNAVLLGKGRSIKVRSPEAMESGTFKRAT